jgi:hypothetical protein
LSREQTGRRDFVDSLGRWCTDPAGDGEGYSIAPSYTHACTELRREYPYLQSSLIFKGASACSTPPASLRSDRQRSHGTPDVLIRPAACIQGNGHRLEHTLSSKAIASAREGSCRLHGSSSYAKPWPPYTWRSDVYGAFVDLACISGWLWGVLRSCRETS